MEMYQSAFVTIKIQAIDCQQTAYVIQSTSRVGLYKLKMYKLNWAIPVSYTHLDGMGQAKGERGELT